MLFLRSVMNKLVTRRCFYNTNAMSHRMSLNVFKEIAEITSKFEKGEFAEGSKPLSQVVSLRDRFARVMINNTRASDEILQERLDRLVRQQECWEEYQETKSIYPLANMYLLSRSHKFKFMEVKMIHSIGLKCGILNREWAQSRMVRLYGLQSGADSERFKYAQSIFRSRRKKTEKMYNSILSAHAHSAAPEEAEMVLREMIWHRVAPTDVTFWVLLTALAHAGKPHAAREYLKRMEEDFGVQPKYYHYGVVVDGFARTKSPENLSTAVAMVKELVPFKSQEMAFNAILSRCYPPRYPTKKDMEWLEIVIPIAQDVINFLHGAGHVYTVLESTHWRLKVRGISWPNSVLTRPDDVFVGVKKTKKEVNEE